MTAITADLSPRFVEKAPLESYVPPAKPSLVGLSRAELAAALAGIGVPERQRKMRAQQLWHWLYVRGAQEFEEMTNVSRDLAAELNRHFTLARPEVVAEQISVDGTRKWLLRLPGEHPGENAHEVECVYIPDADRGTLCRTAGNRAITNLVMMGMGEPLYNFEAVRNALLIVADNEGLSISKRRITLSTSGVVPMIGRAGAEIGCMLAISLHAVTDAARNELVPLNRKYPIKTLFDACRAYPGLSNARRITFEYVMLKGVNDSLADAKALVRLLKGIPAKINLIPFNPWPGTRYECSDWEQIEKFSEVVFNAGYASPVRTPRGRDILAACGQLKSATEKLSARERLALRAMAMTD
jgi:23S rRNA (adenine2503-C2)-methyltransferase